MLDLGQPDPSEVHPHNIHKCFHVPPDDIIRP